LQINRGEKRKEKLGGKKDEGLVGKETKGIPWKGLRHSVLESCSRLERRKGRTRTLNEI